MITEATARVLMNISDNQGYAPDQITDSLTLGDLLAAIEEAIEKHGEDAMIVLANGQRYGAGYGSIPAYGPVFGAADGDENDPYPA